MPLPGQLSDMAAYVHDPGRVSMEYVGRMFPSLWTSLTGESKRKVRKLLPSKMKDIPLPSALLLTVVKLWEDFEDLYSILSNESPHPCMQKASNQRPNNGFNSS
ncbi:hypothetical protein EMCRGX_G011502 [Ephydatia muelleri]